MPAVPVIFHARASLALLLLAASPACRAGCASTVGELRALLQVPGLALRWQETTMGDGKPLVVSLVEAEGRLHLAFVKTREGLWAEGPATVCADGGTLEAVVTARDIRLGPAAHWLLRQALLARGARFALVPLPGGDLRIGTGGWSGVFHPLAE
jgi:hypothetical protein